MRSVLPACLTGCVRRGVLLLPIAPLALLLLAGCAPTLNNRSKSGSTSTMTVSAVCVRLTPHA